MSNYELEVVGWNKPSEAEYSKFSVYKQRYVDKNKKNIVFKCAIFLALSIFFIVLLIVFVTAKFTELFPLVTADAGIAFSILGLLIIGGLTGYYFGYYRTFKKIEAGPMWIKSIVVADKERYTYSSSNDSSKYYIYYDSKYLENNSDVIIPDEISNRSKLEIDEDLYNKTEAGKTLLIMDYSESPGLCEYYDVIDPNEDDSRSDNVIKSNYIF